MSTETSLTILVIVLSITLAIFLAAGIVLLVKLIQVANAVKRITFKAEQIADKAEAAAELLENASGKLAFGRILSNIFDAVNRKK